MKRLAHPNKQSRLAPFAFTAFIAFEAVLLWKLIGHVKNFALFNPKGFIAGQQMSLMLFTIVLIMTVAVPTVLLLYFFAWKYRASNTKASYNPDMHHGKLFNFVIWTIPSSFMLVLALTLWPAAHRLDPRQPIQSVNKPLTIQVIAMRWKWVFIYPEQHVATVNYIQLPTNTPINFQLSADDAPMSSFWIPNLGGQLYAMTGHVNTLHLMAEKPGDYPGSVAEINGAGFADMKFDARVDTQQKFDDWVSAVKSSPKVLDKTEYERLLKPSEKNPTAVYAIAQSDLWDSMLVKYGSHDMEHMGSMTKSVGVVQK